MLISIAASRSRGSFSSFRSIGSSSVQSQLQATCPFDTVSAVLQRDICWKRITMQNRITEWYQEDQFASSNLSRVDLFEIKAKRSLSLKSTFELPSQVSCISCNAPRGVIAVGQQSGNVSSLHTETSTAVRSKEFFYSFVIVCNQSFLWHHSGSYLWVQYCS